MTRKRKQEGLALIEFAIAGFLLMSVVFGITEFGRAIYQYNTLAKAARDATRFLSVRDPAAPGSVDDARCMAVHGNPSCTGSPLVEGLTLAMVSVCHPITCPTTHQAQGSNPAISLVSVTIGTTDPVTTFRFISRMSFVAPDIPFGPISVTMKQVN